MKIIIFRGRNYGLHLLRRRIFEKILPKYKCKRRSRYLFAENTEVPFTPILVVALEFRLQAKYFFVASM